MFKVKLSSVLVFISFFFYISSANAFLGFFEKKKTMPKPPVEEKLSEDDKIGYIDRNEKSLAQLKSLKIFVSDAMDDNCVFKIKSVLQDNDAIYKVVHSDFKNYTVYFNDGQAANPQLVLTIVTNAGYKPQVKP